MASAGKVGDGGAPSSAALRVGLIGAGAVARQYHLRALLADSRVDPVAIVEPSAEARAALPPLPGVAILDSSEALIAGGDADAIVVCAPTPVHAGIAAAVAATDKHLYLEKPVAMRAEEARSLETGLSRRDAICAVGFNYRLSPAFAELRRRVAAGRVGELRHLRGWHCEAAQPEAMPEWKRTRRTGGGVLLDLVSHQVDFARWLLDDEIASVESARLASLCSEHDDAGIVLRTAGGVVVTLAASYVQGRKHRWEIEGSEGVLRADRWPSRVSSPRRPAPGGPSKLATRLRALPIPRREPSFALALADFVGAALGEGRELPTIANGRRSLEVVLEAERAATGSP